MIKHKTIQVGDLKIGAEEREAINAVLDSGRITEGAKVRDFEKNFSSYIGTKYAVALNSGTSALIAGLTALKYLGIVKENTNIITTPVTYISTSSSIALSGFSPVYVDVDPETFVITPDRIKEYLEFGDNAQKTSVILPVHLMGYACDMEKINALSKKGGSVVFEDSAQALGTVYRGKRAGNMSLLSDFSFYIAHNVQAGEMGALVTDDPEIRRMVTKIKANGRACDCFRCTRSEGICPK
ncbi:MAG: aminotransferase class I/II-fold pyridoxal phosphate-dependent enzyme, partial [Nanoarchaeota archaeon]|nr:aminotransferase class I/II-fold pyridoxal phosphate-dependent enzyme [Nanoarchaeota archaeon]